MAKGGRKGARRKPKASRRNKPPKKKSGFPPWLSKYYALKTLNPGWSKDKLYKEAGKPGA